MSDATDARAAAPAPRPPFVRTDELFGTRREVIM
jgi:hypothetical protein